MGAPYTFNLQGTVGRNTGMIEKRNIVEPVRTPCLSKGEDRFCDCRACREKRIKKASVEVTESIHNIEKLSKEFKGA